MAQMDDSIASPQHSPARRGRVPAVAIAALGFLFLVYGMNATLRQIFYYVLPSMVEEFKLTPETGWACQHHRDGGRGYPRDTCRSMVRPRRPRLGAQVPRGDRCCRLLPVLDPHGLRLPDEDHLARRRDPVDQEHVRRCGRGCRGHLDGGVVSGGEAGARTGDPACGIPLGDRNCGHRHRWDPRRPSVRRTGGTCS